MGIEDYVASFPPAGQSFATNLLPNNNWSVVIQAAKTLVKKGFTVNVQADAGINSKFTNADYSAVGVNVVDAAKALGYVERKCLDFVKLRIFRNNGEIALPYSLHIVKNSCETCENNHGAQSTRINRDCQKNSSFSFFF